MPHGGLRAVDPGPGSTQCWTMRQQTCDLSNAERLDWLRLIRTESVGPIVFRQLLTRFGTAAAALEALPDLARHGGRRQSLRIFPVAAAESELAALDRIGARLLAIAEPDYPEALARIEDAPPLIAVAGRQELLQRPTVAIVGARNASANGRRFAEDLATELGTAGYVIVSGLARGIDGAAHGAALATGTIGVQAGGIDVVYPPEHAGLVARIRETGLLLSECPVGVQPTARHFPRRNRLVSGLALGVVVVEAAPRSGSLITARMAAEQGREVFAVPGSPRDPRARGTNGLIRQGATLVQDAADVIEGLSGQLGLPLRHTVTGGVEDLTESPPAGTDLASVRLTVENALSPSPTPVDEVVRDCQLSAPVVLAVLLELELAGRLERHAGNRVSLL